MGFALVRVRQPEHVCVWISVLEQDLDSPVCDIESLVRMTAANKHVCEIAEACRVVRMFLAQALLFQASAALEQRARSFEITRSRQ